LWSRAFSVIYTQSSGAFLPPYDRVERPRLDRPEHLRRQPEQPHVRRPVPRRPAALEFRLLGLCQHVEPEAPGWSAIGSIVAAGMAYIDLFPLVLDDQGQLSSIL
jgi:hypothetical protein